MKRILLIVFVLVLTSSLFIHWSGKEKNFKPVIASINRLYQERVKTLDSFLSTYPIYFYDSSYATRQQKFGELAYHLKKASGFMVYFEPELYYKKVMAPFQFELSRRQGMTGVIPDNFLVAGPVGPEHDTIVARMTKRNELPMWKTFITDASTNYRKVFGESNYEKHFASLDASGLFDALRTEIFRISSIDIANSDYNIEEAGIPSLNGSVESWLLFTNEVVKTLPSGHTLRKRWKTLSTSAQVYLDTHKNFKTFDRLYFLRTSLVALSQFLKDLQREMKVPFSDKFAALYSNASHIYDKNIFNANYFAPGKDAWYSEDKARLGMLLFFDPILSDNNERSCASCHKPGLAFTDGQVKSTSFDKGILPRNAPTVINSGFQKKQFWDLRTGSLEDQLDSVINNPNELHSSFETVISKINSSPEYVKMFHKAFPVTIKRGIQKEDVKNAIGVYERTLVGMNSRFDKYMRGDLTQLNQQEIDGFNIYTGKAKCGTCHIMPLFNGAHAPYFEITDHRSLGVPVKDTMEKYKVDPDPGMFGVTGSEFVRFSFKVPTLRNVSLTAPYMHNGVYKTLDQVVNFYDHGAGQKFSRDMRPDMGKLPFFTIIPFPLNLTEPEKKALIAFLGALTDTSAALKQPSRLPELKGKYASFNDRKIGGIY